MTNITLKRSLLAVAVAAAFGAGYAGSHAPVVAQAQAAPAVTAVPAPAMPLVRPAAYPDFASIVRAFGPAVVNITVSGKARAGQSEGADDQMSEFLRRFGPGFPRMPQEPRVQRGQGSGFIVAGDGLILTNAHVVDGAQEVTVKLTDRREFKARVVGLDKRADVAVLKIDAAGLPVVKLGDPAATSVGDWVLAIGSPFGFENTATSGIVSAKSRALEGYVPFIQTDVAVNPGNSGGPLFNLKGEVIGINAQIYSASGGYQGLSFAIPIDVAARVRDQLVAHGKVTRGRLGVVIQEVNQGLADSFGLKKPQGALVSRWQRVAYPDDCIATARCQRTCRAAPLTQGGVRAALQCCNRRSQPRSSGTKMRAFSRCTRSATLRPALVDASRSSSMLATGRPLTAMITSPG